MARAGRALTVLAVALPSTDGFSVDCEADGTAQAVPRRERFAGHLGFLSLRCFFGVRTTANDSASFDRVTSPRQYHFRLFRHGPDADPHAELRAPERQDQSGRAGADNEQVTA